MDCFWLIIGSVIASREEIAKAEVEAYYKTHYRLDWLLYRTIGYAVLSSALAIYVFWAEAGHEEHPIQVVLSLSVTWIVLLAMGMLWYDFHTRVSYETWPEVRRRLSRHVLVSLTSFVAAFLLASMIHGVCVLIDNAIAPPVTYKDVKGIAPRTIHWRKGLAPDKTLAAIHAAKPAKKSDKPAAKSQPSSTANKAAAKAPATTKPAAKAPATETKPSPKVPAAVAKKPAPAPKKSPPVKHVAQAPQRSLPRYAQNGRRMMRNGLKYHYYGGRWHLLRRQ